MKRRLIGILLCLALAAAPVTCLTVDAASVLRNGAMTLTLHRSNGHFIWEDGRGGVWHSSPADLEEQEGVKGAVRARLSSLFTGTLYDLESGKETVFYSSNLDLEYSAIPGGYALTAHPAEGVSFRLELTLAADHLALRLPIESLTEREPLVLRDLQILPLFGAGGSGDEGFLLIPDGSGALIQFNNGKKGSYDEPVYGSERATIRTAMAVSKMEVFLPLYGIERNGSAVLALLTEGETAANIRAASAGNGTPYNTVYGSYTLRRRDVQYITQTVSQTLYESPRTLQSDIELRLYPCDGGYVGMAQRLGTYLRKEQGVKSLANPGETTLLSFYGGVRERATFLGIPLWESVGVLTTFGEMGEIIGSLTAAGVTGLSVELLAWEQNQIFGRNAGQVKVPSVLGGTQALDALLALCRQKGVTLYGGLSPLTFSRSGGGVTVSADAVRTIGQSPAAQFRYYPASFAAQETTAHYFLRPDSLPTRQATWQKEMANLGFGGTAFTDLGGVLYSDFSRGEAASRQDNLLCQQAALEGVDGAIAVHGGYFYVTAAADVVVRPPVGSSGMKIADATVPFYQIALSGICHYTTEALGSAANARRSLLFALETGSLLHWEVMGSGSTEALLGSPLEGLSGAVYEENREHILAAVQEVAPTLARISGRAIIDHMCMGADRVKTTYENGISVLVDYARGTFEVSHEGRGGI